MPVGLTALSADGPRESKGVGWAYLRAVVTPVATRPDTVVRRAIRVGGARIQSAQSPSIGRPARPRRGRPGL